MNIMHFQRYLRVFHRNQVNKNNIRTIFSKTKVWDDVYTTDHRKELELFWKESFKKKQTKVSDNRQKYYVLSMFPYPSGKLHMGHVRVYTISDVMAHYNRLQGFNVIHPMGWDAFGLPAENAAIEQKVEPAAWTKKNIEIMKTQLSSLGCQFDWDREISTCDGSYYKWTQYLFIKLYNDGLVYQKMAPVNWDPVDRTVLADEQVDEKGRSWRSGAKVEKVPLKQWYIRTSAYSKSLYDGLSEVDGERWGDVINLQKNWIGECDGARFDFKLKSKVKISNSDEGLLSSPFGIFTKHPEFLYGVSHVVLSHKHILNLPQFYDTSETNVKNGLQKLNISVINPFSGLELPLLVSEDESLFGENLDHHVAIPSINDEDRSLALNLEFPFVEVVNKQAGLVQNSDDISGLTLEEARTAILKKAKSMGAGGHVTSSRHRDWLISRQRYWGTPIPIVHCPKYGVVPVSEDELPVLLPERISLSSKSSTSSSLSSSHQNIKSPLANNTEWLKAKCAKCDCGGHGLRETDTMDTFVDSSWYFLRYLDAHNNNMPFDSNVAKRDLPVDIYIGGKEHATMHLYYARFIHHYLYDCHLTPSREPFKNLLTQGMVLGQSYRLSETGKYLRPEFVEKNPETGKFVEKGTGQLVTTEWEKMSKSKYNGVDPQEVLSEFGCDATRICILSNASPKSDRPWSNEVFVGVERWQRRLWSLVHRFILIRTKASEYKVDVETFKKESYDIDDERNRTLLQVKYHMDKTFLLNTALTRMQMLYGKLSKCSDVTIATCPEFERALADLVIMLSPIAPMFASELWAGISSVNHLNEHYDWDLNVLDQKYPLVDCDFHLPLVVKINNKELTEVPLPMVHSEMESQLTNELAWGFVQQNKKFQELISNLLNKENEGTEKNGETWKSKIISKNLTKYGDYKVELDIILNDMKSSKKRKAAKSTG